MTWIAFTHGLSPFGWVFLFVTMVFLPYAAIKTSVRVREPGGAPTRPRYLFSVFVSQSLLLFPALLAARYDDIDLFPVPHIGWWNIAMAITFLVPALGTLPARWNWRSGKDKERMLWILPNRIQDLSWWIVVALVAGITEEIAYRGVMQQLWQRQSGSWSLSAAICSLTFALAHFVQGWRAVALIVLMTFGVHVIVLASGDLYTAMAIHFIYDLLAGIILLILARRDGLLPRPEPKTAVPIE
jgi:membrane protease YdiL (CAAX protease family)